MPNWLLAPPLCLAALVALPAQAQTPATVTIYDESITEDDIGNSQSAGSKYPPPSIIDCRPCPLIAFSPA